MKRNYTIIPLSLLLLIAMVACSNKSKGNTDSEGKQPKSTVSVPQFDADSAYRYVKEQVDFGPRVPNTAAHKACGEYLAKKLEQFGATVYNQQVDLTAYDGTLLKARNIIGSYKPETKKRIVLLSHWDSRPWADADSDEKNRHTPILGANDGASGVGVLLEIARQLDKQLPELGIDKINGALLDLGVSSHQLDDAARGFSYRADAPLDMRMSQQGETAADLVNTESREELARILRDYGEEPFAWQIAGRIVEARETAPIETTLQLADIVASAMPPAERRKNKNPSRRTFQALRIAVNHELDALEEGLDTIFDHLAPGGRLCVITFHSLEDRLVKNKFRRWSTACTCPPEFPVCVCGGKAKAKLITRKPIEADTQELEENRRSRSAHLRVLEKC